MILVEIKVDCESGKSRMKYKIVGDHAQFEKLVYRFLRDLSRLSEEFAVLLSEVQRGGVTGLLSSDYYADRLYNLTKKHGAKGAIGRVKTESRRRRMAKKASEALEALTNFLRNGEKRRIGNAIVSVGSINMAMPITESTCHLIFERGGAKLDVSTNIIPAYDAMVNGEIDDGFFDYMSGGVLTIGKRNIALEWGKTVEWVKALTQSELSPMELLIAIDL